MNGVSNIRTYFTEQNTQSTLTLIVVIGADGKYCYFGN